MTAKPALPPGPLHRSYRGKMLYITDGVGEMGREYFSVTVQPDGERTLRAQCGPPSCNPPREVLYKYYNYLTRFEAFLAASGYLEASATTSFALIHIALWTPSM